MEQIVIEGFAKNATTLVAGVINEHKGAVLIHLREMNATVTGQWAFGKGVALDVGLVWALQDAVRKLPKVASLEQVVGRIPVGKDQIQVGVNQFKGNAYAFVRRFYPDGDGGWAPSPKGVNVRTELIDELVALVDELSQVALAKGLVKQRHGVKDLG